MKTKLPKETMQNATQNATNAATDNAATKNAGADDARHRST